MNLKMLGIAVAMSAGLAVTAAGAAVVVDPASGGDYAFTWVGGLGRIDEIDLSGSSEWSLTLTRGGIWSFFVSDAFVPGDEFALVLDDASEPWDETDYLNGYFTAYAALFLAPGVHSLSLDLTALAADFTFGEAFASIRRGDLAPIPLPGALPLLGGALAAFGMVRARRKRAA